MRSVIKYHVRLSNTLRFLLRVLVHVSITNLTFIIFELNVTTLGYPEIFGNGIFLTYNPKTVTRLFTRNEKATSLF